MGDQICHGADAQIMLFCKFAEAIRIHDLAILIKYLANNGCGAEARNSRQIHSGFSLARAKEDASIAHHYRKYMPR